jgi:hypothetical protein
MAMKGKHIYSMHEMCATGGQGLDDLNENNKPKEDMLAPLS